MPVIGLANVTRSDKAVLSGLDVAMGAVVMVEGVIANMGVSVHDSLSVVDHRGSMVAEVLVVMHCRNDVGVVLS